MPLRDHFRSPLDDTFSWEGIYGGWPAVIVQRLRKQLPPVYIAEPRAHSGWQVEVDLGAFETDERSAYAGITANGGGVATAVWAPPRPSVAIETTVPESYDEYEVRVFDIRRRRRLVAAVEIISPANLDRPEHRNLFVAKCADLLRKGIAISVVDLVTTRKFNLYADLMAFIGQVDPAFGDPPPLYAASCRWLHRGDRMRLETWSHALALGQALPILPLWLNEDLVVPLDLEASYEQACHDLGIA